MKTPLSLPRPTFLPRKSSLIVISVRGGTFARRSRSSSSHLSTSLFRVSLHVLDLYAREPLMPGRIERLNLASRIRAPITVIIACFTNYSSFISPSVFVFRFEVRETPTIRASLSLSLPLSYTSYTSREEKGKSDFHIGDCVSRKWTALLRFGGEISARIIPAFETRVDSSDGLAAYPQKWDARWPYRRLEWYVCRTGHHKPTP